MIDDEWIGRKKLVLGDRTLVLVHRTTERGVV